MCADWNRAEEAVIAGTEGGVPLKWCRADKKKSLPEEEGFEEFGLRGPCLRIGIP